MKPCRWVSGTLETPVKSGPTSGPLTVSSQLTQLPHGIGPPLQFICVPFRLVNAPTTSPKRLTSTVVVPPWAIGSYAKAGVPEGRPRVVELVVPHQDVRCRPDLERSHAVVTPGQHRAVIERHGELGVVERAVVEPVRQPQPHRTVALVGDGTKRRAGSRGNRARNEPRERSGQDRPYRCCRCTSQKRASIDLSHWTPPLARCPDACWHRASASRGVAP